MIVPCSPTFLCPHWPECWFVFFLVDFQYYICTLFHNFLKGIRYVSQYFWNYIYVSLFIFCPHDSCAIYVYLSSPGLGLLSTHLLIAWLVSNTLVSCRVTPATGILDRYVVIFIGVIIFLGISNFFNISNRALNIIAINFYQIINYRSTKTLGYFHYLFCCQ